MTQPRVRGTEKERMRVCGVFFVLVYQTSSKMSVEVCVYVLIACDQTVNVVQRQPIGTENQQPLP